MRSPVSLMTADLLRTLRSRPALPCNTWYYVIGSTLSVLNRPDEVAKVFQFVIENGSGTTSCHPRPHEQILMARRMRESMIKLTVIAGLPKTINALLALKGVTPSHLLDEPLSPSPTLRAVDVYDVPPARVLQKGQRFFDGIYGKIAKRVMGQMDRSGTEDLGITARLMYSYILSNTSILSSVETSFILLAGLIPQDVNPQLKGHLKGALNNGATVEEIKAVRDLVLQICELYGLRPLQADDVGNWGWRTDVADL